MRQIVKIFSIFTPREFRYCIFLFVAMVVGAVLEAVGIGTILPLISLMGQTDFLIKYPHVAEYLSSVGVHTHIQLVIIVALGLILFYVFKNLYLMWQLRLQINFSLANQVAFSKELMANYLAKPYLFHLNHNTAILLRNINSGGVTVFANILIPTFQLLTEIITVIAIWVMLVVADAFTAIIVAGIMGGLIYTLVRTFRRSINAAGRVQNNYATEYIRAVNQGLGAIKETKVMRKEAYFLDEFSSNYERYGKAFKKYLFLNQLPRVIIETIVVCALLALIIGKVAVGNDPADIVPLLGVLALAAFRLMPSANRIVMISNGIKFQMPLFNELYREFLAIKSRKCHGRVLRLATLPPALPFHKEIRIEKLGFSYPGHTDLVFSEMSFVIPKGGFVGIVGPSGAGKTTFVDILLGLFMPTCGSITVDGVNIRHELRAWQANIAYVPQTIYLVDASIRENVALGEAADSIDEERVLHVLKMAELDEFVAAQPAGLDTIVGERGVKLSGGQKQRIGIARALYQNPTVLILDEATSALDTDTEKSITDTILKFKGHLTIVAIAHRISTLAGCDFKVRFESGQAEVL